MATKTTGDVLRKHTDTEYAGLEQSIKTLGPQGSVYVDDSGYIVDGRILKEICESLGKEYRTINLGTLSDEERKQKRIAMNAERRHLTPKEKQHAIASLLETSPNLSDNAIAKKAGSTNKTVAAARKKHNIPTPEKKIGQDGKARKQPTPRVIPIARKAEQASPSLIHLDPADFERVEGSLDKVADESVDACFCRLSSIDEIAAVGKLVKPDGIMMILIDRATTKNRRFTPVFDIHFPEAGSIAVLRNS